MNKSGAHAGRERRVLHAARPALMQAANNSHLFDELAGAVAVKPPRRSMRKETEPVGAEAVSAPASQTFTLEDDKYLRDALKRCSPSTQEAACAYRRTRSPDHLPAIIHGVIEHYTEREMRAKLSRNRDSLRLIEDLAIDSLTMLEIVFLAEEVLQITIDNDELRPFRTVGDVKSFITAKLAPGA
jgi:3-hydroxyacyl-[acyl-carrier-protein] dehydratase